MWGVYPGRNGGRGAVGGRDRHRSVRRHDDFTRVEVYPVIYIPALFVAASG